MKRVDMIGIGVGALTLAMLAVCASPAASPAPDPPQASVKTKDAFPALAGKQRDFCGAYQDESKQLNDFNAKLAAAGNNPIVRQAVEKTRPDFNKIQIERILAVMGDGSFEDWIGNLDLRVESNRAFVTVQFPCPNTLPYVTAGLFGRMSFGNEWRNGFVPRPASAGIAISSPLGQSLATLQPGELVAATGKLHCVKGTGCMENFPSPARWADFHADFTVIRSLKGGH